MSNSGESEEGKKEEKKIAPQILGILSVLWAHFHVLEIQDLLLRSEPGAMFHRAGNKSLSVKISGVCIRVWLPHVATGPCWILHAKALSRNSLLCVIDFPNKLST